MSRKVVTRDLPPLHEIIPEFKGFQPLEDQHHRMETLLGEAAQRLRGARRRPFYAMRETAAFFGVSVRTVARVYQRLQRQGLLLCARSSMTLLHPRKATPRVVVRGVIGLPVWYPGFLFFHEWRRFFLGLEEELRRHHFVGDLIFYGQGQELDPSFVDRVLARNPDYVFWFRPSTTDEPPLLLLKDAGIPLVILSGLPERVPGRYGLSMNKAMSRGLADWKAHGIRRLEFAEPAERKGHLPEWLRKTIDATGLAHTVVPYADPDSARYLRSLGTRPGTGVLFLDDIVQSFLWRLAPEAVADLARRARVMVEKTVPLAVTTRPGPVFDVLHMDWRRVAAAIARDFGHETVLTHRSALVFEADWRPRIDQATLNTESETL